MDGVIANINPTFWVFAFILVAFVLIQAFVFYKKAKDFNDRHKVLTEEEVKMSKKTGGISVLGPAISVLIVAISFISMFGSGATFMRLGVIGSAQYDLMLADIAGSALNTDINAAGALSESAITLIMFAMALGSAPYFINCIFSLKPLEKAIMSNTSGKKTFATVVGSIATIALIGYFSVEQVTKGPINTVALLASGATTWFLLDRAQKTGKRWLNEWCLGISLIVAIVVAIIMMKAGIGA